MLDDAIAQLAPETSVGHYNGDSPCFVQREIVVRADSAGCTYEFVNGCRSRNVKFAVAAKSNKQIHGAISQIAHYESRWNQGVSQDGDVVPHLMVAEATDLVNLSARPQGTRLIIRREPLDQGAQQSLFSSLKFRFWGHYTDQLGNPVTLDVEMRSHAHVENNIYRLQESGLLDCCAFRLLTSMPTTHGCSWSAWQPTSSVGSSCCAVV